MKLDEYLLYLNAYDEHYAIRQLAIVESHKYALEKYKSQDLAHAIPALKWGINQYLHVQLNGTVSLDNFEEVSKLFENAYSPGENYKITKTEFIRILNDYAFFLSESGDDQRAEGYLLKVIEWEPQRVVAYLNLADVSWNIGKKEQAKSYYQQYLALLGSNTKDVPPRVYDRTKSSSNCACSKKVDSIRSGSSLFPMRCL